MASFTIGDPSAPVEVRLDSWHQSGILMEKLGVTHGQVIQILNTLDAMAVLAEELKGSSIELTFSAHIEIPDEPSKASQGKE